MFQRETEFKTKEVIKMTGATILKFIAETTVVLLIAYGFYREENIIQWERKVFKKLKRFSRKTKRFFRNIKKLGFNGVMEIIKEEIENDRKGK